MGDLIAAIMGFLAGLENSRPRIRCHTLAALAASLLFFPAILEDAWNGSLNPQTVSIVALISSALYILVFFILKFSEKTKRKQEKSSPP